MKKRGIAFFVSFILLISLFAVSGATRAEAADFADQEAFLYDMAEGIRARTANLDDESHANDSEDQLGEYLKELVQYELNKIEKYEPLTFTNRKFDVLAHHYIHACQMQYSGAENIRNEALYEALWEGGRIARYGIIATLYEQYDLPLNSTEVIVFRANTTGVPAAPDPAQGFTTPAPTPRVRQTSGESTVGTSLRDIVYDKSGRIVSLTEIVNGDWLEWTYVYDRNGAFLYRTRNIGNVDANYVWRFIPGTGGSQSVELTTPVENCVGFSLYFKVTKVTKGSALGDRRMYISDGKIWERVGTFSYNSLVEKTVTFTLDYPRTIVEYGTGRVNPDDSAFEIIQLLRDVIVADYDYVELKSEADLSGSAADPAAPRPAA